MKLFKIVTVTFAILIVLYALFGFFMLPGIVKPKVIEAIASSTGKKATIGDIRINPFALSVTVDNVELYDKDNQSMIGARQLYVNFQLISFFNGTYTFAEIGIDSPHVYTKVYPDSTTNFTNFMTASQPEPAERSEPAILVIEKLAIGHGTLVYEDRTRPSPLVSRLDSLNLSLNNFTTRPQENGLYSFEAQTSNGEFLAWKGTVNVAPPRSNGSFRLTGLKGRTIWEFIQDRFNFEITQGVLGIQGEYEFAMKDEQKEFNIRNTSVNVSSLSIIDKATKAEALTISTGEIGGIEFSYQNHSLIIDKITARSSTAFTTREPDGSFGLKTLLMPKPSEEKDSTKWDILIRTIDLQEWACTVTDNNTTPATQLILDPASVKIENFHMDTDEPATLNVQTTVNKSGTVALSGTFTLLPITSTLSIQCTGLGLKAFQPYVDNAAQLKIESGNVDVNGRLTYIDRGKEGDKTFKGTVAVHSFRGVDPILRDDFLRWKMLAINNIDFSSAPAFLSIQEIAADGAYIRFIIDSNRTTNLHHIMASSTDTGATGDTTQPAQKSMKKKIGAITIQNSSMNFADFSLYPQFATGIQQLSGSIKDLSSDNLTHAEVDITGRVDQYAPVTIMGQINPLSNDVFTDITMKFQNIELTTFTPYSGKFAGYKIDKGKLTLDLHYKLNQNFLQAENKVIVNQLELGDEVEGPDVTGLPVKLAIALLTDVNGVIDLDLPIEGNINDPEFSVFPLIMKVLVNLVTKAVTAPFKLLGSLFGGSDEDLSYLQFAPGSGVLTAEQSEKLDQLSKALTDRPALQLDIRGVASDSLDKRALAEKAFAEQLKGTTGGTTTETLSAQDEDRLLQLYNTTFHTAPDSLLSPVERTTMANTPELRRRTMVDRAKERIIQSIQITGQDLRTLALQRASTIKERLVYQNKIQESRIFILDAQLGSVPVDGQVQLPLNLNAR